MWPREISYRSQKSGLPFSWFKNRREVRETVCKRLHRPSKFYHQSRELQYGRCIWQTHPLNLFQIFTGTNLATWSFLIRSELELRLVYFLLFFVLGWITIILFWTMWYSNWTIVSPRLLKVPSKVRFSPPQIWGSYQHVTSEEEAIKKEFAEDLPMPQSFEHEVIRWKFAQQDNDSITSLAEAVASCDERLYPSISTIFQLLLTLPVGSCSCERSFSALAPKVENKVTFIDGLQQAEWSCISLCKQRNPCRAARCSTAMGC